jgi:hypothetical protein
MSTATDAAFAVERGFWQDGSPDFYRRTIAEGGLSVIEPLGAISRDMAIRAAAAGDRWVDLEMTDVVANEITPDCVVLAYHARAKRESDGSAYAGSIASTYVRRDATWQLALTCHQPWTPRQG